MRTRVEYIWLDGTSPLPRFRSKTRFIKKSRREFDELPEWNFDGGSTNQGSLEDSDRILKPVRVYDDPFIEGGGLLALCEVYDKEDPHSTNTRQTLRKVSEGVEGIWVGMEQEFTLINPTNNTPLGLLLNPKEQGDYYCGVGCLHQIGRYVLTEFEEMCRKSGLNIDGINAEVMPGQWEFQTCAQDPLKTADDLWVARYILERVAEQKPVVISYDPKPHADFNGAGCHTNFSTEKMRTSFSSEDWEGLLPLLKQDHAKHIKVCGEGIERRMTGECETSDYNEFSWGVGDRGASIRIPGKVSTDGAGYFEDRRPCANIDPYLVISSLISSVKKSKLL